jgi:PilZ domain
MSGSDRRRSPRKVCAIPLQFKLIPNGNGAVHTMGTPEAPAAQRTAEGQALNVSERGMYFTSPEKLSVGQAIEMFFVLPGELTGRNAEPVKCNARVMHVDYASNIQGIGVSVDRFETVAGRNWSN